MEDEIIAKINETGYRSIFRFFPWYVDEINYDRQL